MQSNFTEDLKAVAAALRALKTLVVLSHYNPDADAYGSLCALSLALRSLGKEVHLVNESPLDKRYRGVPLVSEIKSTLPKTEVDAIVTCDCGDVTRFGDSLKSEVLRAKIINIDHHISNSRFGAFNYVEPEASSTCEMVFKLIKELKVSFSKDIASCLLLGIVGDTGSFRYPSTRAHTFEAAAELVRAGARPSEIASWQFENRPLAGVKLNAHLISKAEFLLEGRVALAVAPAEDYVTYSASVSDTEGLVEELRLVEGVLVSAFMRRDGDIWRVSLRGKDPAIDLSHVATMFGGGGHKAAAAFRSREALEDVQKKLLALLETEILKVPK